MATLTELVDAHALLAMEQQLHLADVVGDRPWNADLTAGTLGFGSDLSFRAELLGTEAGTFMWAWANPGGFPDHVTATSRALRALGEADGIPELAQGEVELDGSHPAAHLAVVAVGHAGAPACYSGPTGGGGRAHMLLGADPALELPAPEVPRLMTTLTLVLEGGYVGDWPRAIEAYAAQRGLTLTHEDGALRLTGAGLDGHARIVLDELGRVAELTARAGGGDDGEDAGIPEPPKRGLLGRLRRG